MYSYAFSLFFMYGDLDSVIFVMIVETLLWAIGAIFVTLLAAQGWRTALVGGITMASIDLDLIGVMLIWDIKLNPPAFVCLVMAVGLAVDYCVHIAHGFEEVRSRPPPFIMRETRHLPNQLSRAAFSALLHKDCLAASDCCYTKSFNRSGLRGLGGPSPRRAWRGSPGPSPRRRPASTATGPSPVTLFFEGGRVSQTLDGLSKTLFEST